MRSSSEMTPVSFPSLSTTGAPLMRRSMRTFAASLTVVSSRNENTLRVMMSWVRSAFIPADSAIRLASEELRVERAHGVVRIALLDDHAEVDAARALRDHEDVDARARERPEDLRRD